jgi:hypothetical protein
MKTALPRIIEFFAGRYRREKENNPENNPTNRGYCICGAPKPEVRARRIEAALKREGRHQSMNTAGK